MLLETVKRAAALPVVWVLWVGVASGAAELAIQGRVESDTHAPLMGARVLLQDSTGAVVAASYTDAAGSFALAVPQPGSYRVTVELVGFFPLHQDLVVDEQTGEVVFTLVQARELVQRVEVSARPPSIDMDTTASPDSVTGTDIQNVPYPTSHSLRNALRIMPSIVHDSRGGLHIDGGQESQTLYMLNGFNISDPLTGRFETRLSVEAVQSIEVSSGLIPAQYGKGSAGVLEISTRTGDDKFRATATNFVPGVEYHKGLVIGNWVPRANLSGPIRKGRAWFSYSVDTEYVNTVIEELPKGQDRYDSWRWNNYLFTQWNVRPSNIFYAGFLGNLWTAPRHGLSALDPRETTVDRRERQWFFHLKDQAYLPNRVLLEVGYGANRTFGREIPQGHELYRVTPDGRQGNYFVDAVRRGARDQILANVYWPSFQWAGQHRLRGGVDLNRVAYWQDVRRTGYEIYGVDGSLKRRTVFAGSGLARLANYEASVYVQDSWRLRPSFLAEAGLRGDWDQLLGFWSWAPRLGFAWTPLGAEHTKLTGGFALVHDATLLRLFLRPRDQYYLTTYYQPGGTVRRGPALTLFTWRNPALRRPQYRNFFLAVEREWAAGIHTRIDFLRRRGRDGFTYKNLLASQPVPADLQARFPGWSFDAVNDLTNDRRDQYDAIGLTVRQDLGHGYGWLVSYRRSRAFSNAVVDINLEDPIVTELNVGPMPWDAPNRLKAWGYLPTPWKRWAVAFLLEWRTGFPFSVVDDEGRVVGAVNSWRFPDFFELDLHVERQFSFSKHLWALRVGCNNLTGHHNPDVVINNVESPKFLTFYGGSGRTVNFRIRWLGKKP